MTAFDSATAGPDDHRTAPARSDRPLIVVLSAGLSQPSSTRLLADRIAEAVSAKRLWPDQDGALPDVVHVELRELAHDITNNLLTGFPSEALRVAIDSVAVSDALIAVTPVFSASFSGLFKSFFDVLDRGSLADKPTLIAATGGSARHSLALEYSVRPLMAYLHARTVPTPVFAATEDFGSDTQAFGSNTRASLAARIDRAAGELALMIQGTRPATRIDPFDLPLSFEELLAR